jgi:hypothetical protein
MKSLPFEMVDEINDLVKNSWSWYFSGMDEEYRLCLSFEDEVDLCHVMLSLNLIEN